MSTTLSQQAPAKINLCLHVTGQRDDGYHLLDSLVVFAGVADTIDLTLATRMSLDVSGPFAAGVPTDRMNLMWRVAEALFPDHPVAMRLTKNLPHPAGIGGGSSDAAAVLRGLARLSGHSQPGGRDVMPFGADLPVCLSPVPQTMQGIGEIVTPGGSLPQMAIVLANPGVSMPTGQVFKAMEHTENTALEPRQPGLEYDDLIAWLGRQRNDLEAPARQIAPIIDDVLAALAASGADLVRMSGSGATCFGLYRDLNTASQAATSLRATGWWVSASKVLDPYFSRATT